MAQSLRTCPKVDLKRYAGKWNEVARLPVFFQRGCTHSTAEYGLNRDGIVSVINACLRNGKPEQIRGTARVVDPQSNAVLEVRFDVWYSLFIPRAPQGNYFILWVAPDYSAAAVGTPGRDCLWILARERSLPAPLFRQIVEDCRQQGFPVGKLIVEQGQSR